LTSEAHTAAKFVESLCGYQPYQKIKNYRGFRDHQKLMMGKEMGPEISLIFNGLK
jgi:hypothetical protein